jgi:hypothetical protein
LVPSSITIILVGVASANKFKVAFWERVDDAYLPFELWEYVAVPVHLSLYLNYVADFAVEQFRVFS